MAASHPALAPSPPAWLASVLLCGLGVLLCTQAQAGIGADAVARAYQRIPELEQALIDRVLHVVTGPALREVTDILFRAMALALIVLKCMGWGLRGFQTDDVLATVSQIGIVALLMAWYPTLVPAIFNATLYIGQVLMSGIVGVPMAPDSAGQYSVDLTRSLVAYSAGLRPDCELSLTNPLGVLDCLKGALSTMVSTVVVNLLTLVLGIVVMQVDIWGFWVYSIGLATGLLLLPFALYKRLGFLFDGWLRFFFGGLVYVIVARVNVAIVSVAVLNQLGSSPSTVASGVVNVLAAPIKDLTDVAAPVMFFTVGIFSLISTGRFASAIVAGAGGGGINLGKMLGKAFKFAGIGLVGAFKGLKARGAKGAKKPGRHTANSKEAMAIRADKRAADMNGAHRDRISGRHAQRNTGSVASRVAKAVGKGVGKGLHFPASIAKSMAFGALAGYGRAAMRTKTVRRARKALGVADRLSAPLRDGVGGAVLGAIAGARADAGRATTLPRKVGQGARGALAGALNEGLRGVASGAAYAVGAGSRTSHTSRAAKALWATRQARKENVRRVLAKEANREAMARRTTGSSGSGSHASGTGSAAGSRSGRNASGGSGSGGKGSKRGRSSGSGQGSRSASRSSGSSGSSGSGGSSRSSSGKGSSRERSSGDRRGSQHDKRSHGGHASGHARDLRNAQDLREAQDAHDAKTTPMPKGSRGRGPRGGRGARTRR